MRGRHGSHVASMAADRSRSHETSRTSRTGAGPGALSVPALRPYRLTVGGSLPLATTFATPLGRRCRGRTGGCGLCMATRSSLKIEGIPGGAAGQIDGNHAAGGKAARHSRRRLHPGCRYRGSGSGKGCRRSVLEAIEGSQGRGCFWLHQGPWAGVCMLPCRARA